MAKIAVEEISKSFPMEDGTQLDVLDNLTFEIEDGEFFALVGPSGCGKSTLLDIICGLTQPDAGAVNIGNGHSEDRIGFVFQDPTLLDWRTIRQNLKYALKGMGVPEEQYDERIQESLEMIGLAEFGNQYPQTLSGGMQQRVGLARGFCVKPEILLMDEPFGSLDEITARKLRQDLLKIWKQEQKTILFITHDISEAVYLADRVGIMGEKPTRIASVVDIDLPRPRSLQSPELPEYEEHIIDKLGVG